MTFNITPVFFNIGINEQATLADKLGLNGPQEKNNSDNFKILLDYVRRFRKSGFFAKVAERKGRVGGRGSVGGNDEVLVDDLMSILRNEVANKKSKNVDVLNLASQICLKLNGEELILLFGF